MKRRSFLKNAAFLTAAASAAPVLSGCRRKETGEEESRLEIARDFRYGSDGTFKVLQFTDTHYITGDPRSERALSNVREMLDAERPDFVIHTGDILFGHPDIPSAQEILQPIADRGIPFAVALGNHDSQFGASREEVFRVIRGIPGCVNLPPKEGVYGCSNDVITLSGPGGVDRALYLFDSMDAVILKGEEEIHCYGGRILAGENGEPPCPSRLNSGLLAQMRELGDIQAIVNGHDHDCDYVLDYGQMYYIYGRFSGCDTTYNHLGPSGARIFQFTQDARPFRTWVRLQGGEVRQDLILER